MSSNNESDRRQWDVFRYVAGELTDQEESAFEQQLETDHSLREEVASMVGGLNHVRDGLGKALQPVAVHCPVPSRMSRLIALAAMLLIGGLSVLLLTLQAENQSGEEAIALKWADSFDDSVETELAEFTDDFDDQAELSEVTFEETDWILDAFEESEEG